MSGITLQEVGGSLVINVPDEQTLIGRGQFLQVTDKRVSRSHALLNVLDRKLYITPTHTNPCFLRRQNKEQSIMAKDVKTVLNHGDAFGLLPDQLFYLVRYPQMNGNKESEKVEEKEQEKKDEKSEKEKEEPLKSTDKADISDSKEEVVKEEAKVQNAKDEKEKEENKEAKEDDEEEIEEEEAKDDISDEKEEVETPAGNMALPLDKKRPLPDWMKKVSDTSPQKAKASPKKVKTPAVNKREPGQKLTKAEQNEDHNDDDGEEEEEEEEKLPTKNRAKAKKDSDEDEEFDEADMSDDDYVPEAIPKATKSRSRRKRYSDSEEEEDFSDDDDDDYAPSKKKARTPKKTPKGKGKKTTKGRQTPSRSAKKTTGRGRKKYQNSDDDDDADEVLLPRRRGAHYDDDDDDDDSPSRRPQRAARQKRGSYVDDPMIEEALEDFASEGSVGDGNEDKDSDFDVNEAVDSGSDWEKKGKKQKVTKAPRAPKSPRSVTKKGKKKAPRRTSKSKTYSDDDEDDEDMEDDEPYVPRPSKRRAAASQESGESDDDKKKRRRREPCQYGHKCYRKNPVHFRTYCHPGDSSYDEEDKDTSPVKDNSKKPTKDAGKTTPDKPSRPQRSTAGTRLVTPGADDDDLPDTYDYNDSFIDDGTQPTDDSDQDSDYDASEDTKGTVKDAKKFLKNKKMTKPVGAD